MKENYSHMTFLLDRTGSMTTIRDDVISGFNSMLDEHRAAPGDMTVSVIQFDKIDPYEVLCDFVGIADVKPLSRETFVPRDWTPLWDAMGKTIVGLGERLSAMKEEERPSVVILVIFTDGQENSSIEYNKQQIQKMIQEQQDTYGWRIMFQSCDEKALRDAADIGVATMDRFIPTSAGIKLAYNTTSDRTLRWRAGKSA